VRLARIEFDELQGVIARITETVRGLLDLGERGERPLIHLGREDGERGAGRRFGRLDQLIVVYLARELQVVGAQLVVRDEVAGVLFDLVF
jgi:hypothetical protein